MLDNNVDSEKKTKIYIFKSRSKHGHLHLDNKKSVVHDETIELDKEDLKRPVIKEMIREGEEQNKDKYGDRLIPVEKPDDKE